MNTVAPAPFRNPIRKHYAAVRLAVPLLLLQLSPACTDVQDNGGRAFLDGLPREMMNRLVSDDDTAFAVYGSEVGSTVLLDAAKKLDARMSDMILEGRDSDALTLITYTKRVARVLASEYQYQLYYDRLVFFERMSPEIRRTVIGLESDYYSFRSEIDKSAGEKIERYEQLLEMFRRHDELLFVALCEYEMAYAYRAIGDIGKSIRHLKAACRDYTRCGLHEMSCPTLCELGEYYEEIGETDSMIVCFEKAKRIANHSRLPWEASQISALYAKYYARHGRLALAYDLLNDSMERCRRYKGKYSELEFVVETMRFQAAIGCWNIVDRLLERARLLLRMYAGTANNYINLYALQVDRIEARLNMARGNVEEAESIFRRTEKAIDDLIMPYTRGEEHAKLLLHRSQGLLENGRAGEALEAARDGLLRSEETKVADYPARFALLQAKAALMLGETKTASQALRLFEHLAPEKETILKREWIERDALGGELRMAEGDSGAVVRSLEEGLTRLRVYALNMDAGVQSYLWINDCVSIRNLMHTVTARDPELGYGAELYWRDFYRLLGRRAGPALMESSDGVPGLPFETYSKREGYSDRSQGAPDGASDCGTIADGEILNAFRACAGQARTCIGRLNAVHCIYTEHGDRILRWTTAHGRIRCDTVDAYADTVRMHVKKAWSMMSEGPAIRPASNPAEPYGTLRTLARLLLPPEVRAVPESPSVEPFLVTADGFLGLIPFETFDIGRGDAYVPLLKHRDVAYLRYADGTGEDGATETGVILVSEKPSQETLRRYPFQPALEEVMAEGETAASLFPGSRFLAGESASKPNLLSVWENASFLYIAAHMLRDPQVPYMMLIPLAPSPGKAGPAAAYLDVADIRAADLDGCRCVILSGCSSGAPYLEARISGPSLGDAFLDAGAGAAVYTFWDVLDSHARRLMTSYLQRWRSNDSSMIRALCDVRREALESPESVQNPFAWASYGIKVGRP